MGFEYLAGKRWIQVTRDERFFCQRLYELINAERVEVFAQYLSDLLDLDLPIKGEWEIGYEVCFYRDLWQQRGRSGKLYSPKRTFDLCLFSESAIVIIEAKAVGGFDSEQNEVFKRDIAEVKRLTQVNNVQLVGLCSSKCEIDQSGESTFGAKVVRWSDLAARYGGDEILKRADSIYEKHEAFAKCGRNSDIKLSGDSLLKAFRGGAEWWVGRGGGGITGDRFFEDVCPGRWRIQVYEVSTKANAPPSPNYFSLAEFVQAVEQGGAETVET
ncbi:hypothetical protein ACFL6U_03795 [Planctomycetota bacterium]